MRIAIHGLLFIIGGCAFAWVPMVAICSIPGMRYSNACGHNAAYWLILTIPIGFLCSWLFATWVVGRLPMRTKQIRFSDK